MLAAAGSAFAVAVSVVVFMSTPFYQQSRPLSYQAERQQTQSEQVAEGVPQDISDHKNEEADVSMPAAPEQALKAEDDAFDSYPKSKRKTSVPSAQLKRRVAEPLMDKADKGEPDHNERAIKAGKPLLESAVSAPEPEKRYKDVQEDNIQAGTTLPGINFGALDEYQAFLAAVKSSCDAESAEVDPEVLLKQARDLQTNAAYGDGQRQVVIGKIVKLLEEDMVLPELCDRLESVLCAEAGLDCPRARKNQQHINENNNREQWEKQ